jgi:hypothetical protein
MPDSLTNRFGFGFCFFLGWKGCLFFGTVVPAGFALLCYVRTLFGWLALFGLLAGLACFILLLAGLNG